MIGQGIHRAGQLDTARVGLGKVSKGSRHQLRSQLTLRWLAAPRLLCLILSLDLGVLHLAMGAELVLLFHHSVLQLPNRRLHVRHPVVGGGLVSARRIGNGLDKCVWIERSILGLTLRTKGLCSAITVVWRWSPWQGQQELIR